MFVGVINVFTAVLVDAIQSIVIAKCLASSLTPNITEIRIAVLNLQNDRD